MDSHREPAVFAVGLGIVGLVFGACAAASWFIPSAKEMGPPLAIIAGMCSLGAGWGAYKMRGAVEVAEREVNQAIDLLVAAARQPRVKEVGIPVIDPETGLPGQAFFDLAVRGRVAAARRHLWPISVVLIDLRLQEGMDEGEDRTNAMNQFVGLLRQTLRESDMACKLGENSFGLILDDTSEEGGVWTAERLQIALAKNATNVRQIAAGVATYPTHALHADEILKRANTALARAAATASGDGLGHVEVAHVDLN